MVSRPALIAARWRFNYGRKLTPSRIAHFALPDSQPLKEWIAGKVESTMEVIAASLAPYQEDEVPEPKFDRAVFAEIERDPVSLDDVESVMRQVMEHPAKPVSKSENREPSREELRQRWKLFRRG